MKIIDETNKQLVEFNSLTHGDTFRDGNDIYMKVGVSKDPITNGTTNSILLRTGTACWFNGDDMVEPILCELHIVNMN